MIGKLYADSPDMMYPNANYLKYFPDEELPASLDESKRSSCLRMGAYAVIKKIIKDYQLDSMIGDIIGRDMGLFLDIAACSIIAEDNAEQY